MIDLTGYLNGKVEQVEQNPPNPPFEKGGWGDFEGDQLQRQIEKTDREIDTLVYKLYGITEQEQSIVAT